MCNYIGGLSNRWMMDISAMYSALYAAAEINVDSPYSQQDSIKLIKQVSNSIELKQRQLHDRFVDDNDALVQQIIQQTRALSALLAQQVQMLEQLQQKYGIQLRSKCNEDIQEILCVANQIQASLNRAVTFGANADPMLLNDLAANAFAGATRLNLMQQRISGKMRKAR